MCDELASLQQMLDAAIHATTVAEIADKTAKAAYTRHQHNTELIKKVIDAKVVDPGDLQILLENSKKAEADSRMLFESAGITLLAAKHSEDRCRSALEEYFKK